MKSRLNDNDVPKIISDLNKKLVKFTQLLILSTEDKIMAMWDSSVELRILFSGGTIMLNQTYGLSIKLSTFTSWRNDLHRVMTSSLATIAETMLATNKDYASWFYGKNGLNLGTTDVPIFSETTGVELRRHFELALFSGSTKIVDWLWKDNENLWRAILDLSSKKQADYIEKAKNEGYELTIIDEDQVSLKIIPKKRKAVESLESDTPKRAKLSSQSSTPDFVKRYYLRGVSSQPTHFKSQSVSSAPFNPKGSEESKEMKSQQSPGF